MPSIRRLKLICWLAIQESNSACEMYLGIGSHCNLCDSQTTVCNCNKQNNNFRSPILSEMKWDSTPRSGMINPSADLCKLQLADPQNLQPLEALDSSPWRMKTKKHRSLNGITRKPKSLATEVFCPVSLIGGVDFFSCNVNFKQGHICFCHVMIQNIYFFIRFLALPQNPFRVKKTAHRSGCHGATPEISFEATFAPHSRGQHFSTHSATA